MQHKEGKHKRLGAWGENRAAVFLCQHGFYIQERNVFMRCGELDIVATKNNVLWFFEVKTRTRQYDLVAEMVHARKRTRMMRAARLYCARNKCAIDMPVRFAVVVVWVCKPTSRIKVFNIDAGDLT